MLKRRPRLIDPRIMDRLTNMKQLGGSTSKSNFVNQWIYPFFTKYYMLIIIVLALLLFLYWRYRTKLDEDKTMNMMLMQMMMQQQKQKQNPHSMYNFQMINPHLVPQRNPMLSQQLNQQMMEPINPRTGQYESQNRCNSCAMKDPYKFDEQANDLMYRNTKNIDTDLSQDYYGMVITDMNDNNMRGDFMPSNGAGDFYFPLK